MQTLYESHFMQVTLATQGYKFQPGATQEDL